MNLRKPKQLNAAINRGDFLLFLSPSNQLRYEFLTGTLPARYQQQIHEAFYVFRDEEMIATLYTAVSAFQIDTTL